MIETETMRESPRARKHADTLRDMADVLWPRISNGEYDLLRIPMEQYQALRYAEQVLRRVATATETP